MYKEDYKAICAFFKHLKAIASVPDKLATIYSGNRCHQNLSPKQAKIYIDEQKANLARLTRLTERNYMPVEPVDYIRK